MRITICYANLNQCHKYDRVNIVHVVLLVQLVDVLPQLLTELQH